MGRTILNWLLLTWLFLATFDSVVFDPEFFEGEDSPLPEKQVLDYTEPG